MEMRGVEPRTSHMRSERSTTELHPLIHFGLPILSNVEGSCGGKNTMTAAMTTTTTAATTTTTTTTITTTTILPPGWRQTHFRGNIA